MRELTDLLEGRSEENSTRVDEIIQYLQEKDSEKDIRIKSCKLSQLCSPKEIFLVAYGCLNTIKLNHSKHVVKAMPPEETIKLAKYFLSYPEAYGKNHFKENNCEMFACFCKTGLTNIAAQLHPKRLVLYELAMEPYTTAEEALENYNQH